MEEVLNLTSSSCFLPRLLFDRVLVLTYIQSENFIIRSRSVSTELLLFLFSLTESRHEEFKITRLCRGSLGQFYY